MNDLFKGEYNHSIDPKGRIIVPSKFRELLGDSFVVTKGLDGCLWAFPEKEWDDFSGKLHSLQTSNRDASYANSDVHLSSKDVRKMTRFFMGSAVDAETDKQGRTLLPQPLRDYAGLEKEIVLVGVSNRVEIWDKKKWDQNSTFDDIELIAENMGELGFGF